jgi:hypothetical protein
VSVAVLVARLILAAVFAVAGVGKLLRREETAATLGSFGVGGRWRGPVAIGLPLAELAVAFGLLPAVSAAWAGAAAFLLLAAFTAGVVRVLRSGEEVDCNCFGQIAPSRVSGLTLVRNGGLLALAAFVAAAGAGEAGPNALGWVGELDTAALAAVVGGLALVAAAVNFAFAWQLMSQNGRLVARLEEISESGAVAAAGQRGLPIGEMAPAFALDRLGGGRVELDELLDDGSGLLLFFTDPGCGACEPILPEIARLGRDPLADPRPVTISLGDPDAIAVKAAAHGLSPVLLLDDFERARKLGINGFPGALVLDRDGRVASEPAVGGVAVTALLASLAAPGGPGDPLRLIKVGAS